MLSLVSTQRGAVWIVLLPYGSGSTRLKEGEEQLGIHSPQTQLCAEASKTAPPCHSGSFSLFFCFFFLGGGGGRWEGWGRRLVASGTAVLRHGGGEAV